MTSLQSELLARVAVERRQQDKKWGEQNHSDLYWLGVLMEEVGEVAKAIIEGVRYQDVDKELTQVAAVCIAWQESTDRRVRNQS